LFGQHLTSNGYRVIQSVADANTDIVQAALHLATVRSVTVIADDTDIIILLVHHVKSTMSDIYILSSYKTGPDHKNKLVSIRNVQSATTHASVLQLHYLLFMLSVDVIQHPHCLVK